MILSPGNTENAMLRFGCIASFLSPLQAAGGRGAAPPPCGRRQRTAVRCDGRTGVEMEALTDCDRTLKTGETVQVVGVTDEDKWVVRPLSAVKN